MSANEADQKDLQLIAEIDRIIHEPGRLMILAYLYVVESADFLFLERQTGLTRGNLSRHAGKLEAAGYVAVEKKFVDKIPRTVFRLTDKGHQAFRDYRQQILRVLGGLPD